MVRNAWLMLVGLILLAPGCQAPQPPAGDHPDRAAVGPEQLSQITDVQWTLESMVAGGRPVALTGDRPWLRFEPDGRVAGVASINRFFGLMLIEAGGRVRWPGALASTRMAGPPALMRQESTFLAALQTVTNWSIEGTRLYGQDAEGLTQLVFATPTP